MVNVVTVPSSEGQFEVSRETADLARLALPIMMASVAIIASLLLLQRVNLLRTWNDSYGGSGNFGISSCEGRGGIGADQWICSGVLASLGTDDLVSTTLITSKGAYVSKQPIIGSSVGVFFDSSSPERVYPDSDSLGELARLYFSLLPRLLIALGAAQWLLGWYLSTFGANVGTWLAAKPSLWQTRGIIWLVTGLGATALNFAVVHLIVGSLGIV